MSTHKGYRLKLPTGTLPLPPGAYEIGRSAHCQVILEGAKVSRLHARIVVDDRGVAIEDLGSSNGVFVNNKRISRGKAAVAPGDRLLVGDVELELTVGDLPSTVPPDARPSGRPTLVESLPSPSSAATSPRTTVTTKAHALELLGSVAERAIGTGDAKRAEMILEGRLREVLDAAGVDSWDARSRELAVESALLLARSLPAARWLDFAVDLLAATRTLPSERELSAFESAVTRVTGADARKLQHYTTLVQSMPSSLEKVRSLKRLEALLAAVCGRQ
ncbi:MAG: FHA domain-containing protein [Myxococcales bacterium]|nr:FHA domain-containing protein [Myxococcales bacterium]